MTSLAEKYIGLPVTFVASDLGDDEEPVMYLLRQCVDFVNHPHSCEGRLFITNEFICLSVLVYIQLLLPCRYGNVGGKLRHCQGDL